MRVKFIKLCVWDFKGKIRRFSVGDARNIPDKDAAEMIQHGYAVIAPGCQKTSAFSADERHAFYKKNYSLTALKDFCKRQKVPIKGGKHRTIPTIIEVIVEFEEKNGLIKE